MRKRKRPAPIQVVGDDGENRLLVFRTGAPGGPVCLVEQYRGLISKEWQGSVVERLCVPLRHIPELVQALSTIYRKAPKGDR